MNHNKILKLFYITITALFIIVLAGCNQPSSYYNGESGYIKLSMQNQLLQDKLTIDAKNFLISVGEFDNFLKNPDKTIKNCIDKIIPGMYGCLFSNQCYKPYKILAELCIYTAKNSKDSENDEIKYWMTTCMLSYKYLFDGESTHILPLSPESGLVIDYYNFSLIKVFTYIKSHNYIDKSKYNIPTLIGKVNFSYPQSDLPWKVHSFEDFIIGFNYDTKNFNEKTVQLGVGIPLGGVPFKDDQFDELTSHIKIIKYMYPCTFFLKFKFTGKKTASATPCYLDFYNNTFININGQRVVTPNAFSVMLGNFLDIFPQRMTTNYFFSPEKIIDNKMGIYMLTDYDKDKIPVVFIHGLISNPQSFGQMINTLMQSETIREHFQFWFLYYPTGQPIILDADDLRSMLNTMDKKFNLIGESSKFNDMILIGYSLGGLIAQLCVQSSDGDYFKQKVIENNKTASNKIDNVEIVNKLDKILRFEPLPYVKDVVFISTPHKGAEMASWLVFQLIADFMTTSPENYNRNLQFISELPTKYNDQIISANALYNLMPKSSFIKLIQTLPFGKNVRLYSVISDKNGPDNPAGTDGIITYESAHLKNATEEVIIKSDHHPILHPACTREVLKILIKTLYNDEQEDNTQKK